MTETKQLLSFEYVDTIDDIEVTMTQYLFEGEPDDFKKLIIENVKTGKWCIPADELAGAVDDDDNFIFTDDEIKQTEPDFDDRVDYERGWIMTKVNVYYKEP